MSLPDCFFRHRFSNGQSPYPCKKKNCNAQGTTTMILLVDIHGFDIETSAISQWYPTSKTNVPAERDASNCGKKQSISFDII